MRAIRVNGGAGSADALYIEENEPNPDIFPGRAIVKVCYFALNRLDILQRQGQYDPPKGYSTVLGVEFSGIISGIHDKDSNSSKFKVGDLVFGLTGGGAYAEYVSVPIGNLMHVPKEISLREAAAIPEVWFTALQALDLVGGIQSKEKVVIHAGSSGVGIAAIQIAQIFDATHIYTTVGSDEKKNFIQNMLKFNTNSEIIAINYKVEDFRDVIKKVSGSVNLIVDPVGQSYFARNLDSLELDGRLVLLASLSGPIVNGANIAQIIPKRLKIQGTTLRSRSIEYQSMLREKFEAVLLPKFESKQLKVIIHDEFTMNEISDAHKLMENNQNIGKIVVKID